MPSISIHSLNLALYPCSHPTYSFDTLGVIIDSHIKLLEYNNQNISSLYRRARDPESTLLSSIWCEEKLGDKETHTIIEKVWGEPAAQTSDIAVLQKGLPNPPSTRYISGQVLKSVEREKRSLPLMALVLNHLGAYHKSNNILPPEQRIPLYKMSQMDMYILIGSQKTSAELAKSMSRMVNAWTEHHHALWYCIQRDHKRLKRHGHPLHQLMKSMGIGRKIPWVAVLSKIPNFSQLYGKILSAVHSTKITLQLLDVAGLPRHVSARLQAEYNSVGEKSQASKAANAILNCLDERQRAVFHLILHCISEKMRFEIVQLPPAPEYKKNPSPIIESPQYKWRRGPFKRGSSRGSTKRGKAKPSRAAKNASLDPRVLVCIECLSVCTTALGQKQAGMHPVVGAIVDTSTHEVRCATCLSDRMHAVDTSKYAIRCNRLRGPGQSVTYSACSRCKTPCVNVWDRICADCKQSVDNPQEPTEKRFTR